MGEEQTKNKIDKGMSIETNKTRMKKIKTHMHTHITWHQ